MVNLCRSKLSPCFLFPHIVLLSSFFLAPIFSAQVGLLKLSAVWQSAQRPSRKSSMLRKGAGTGNTVLLKISNPCDEVWQEPDEMVADSCDEGLQTIVNQTRSSKQPLWWFLNSKRAPGKVVDLALWIQFDVSWENHSLSGQTWDKTIGRLFSSRTSDMKNRSVNTWPASPSGRQNLFSTVTHKLYRAPPCQSSRKHFLLTYRPDTIE